MRIFNFITQLKERFVTFSNELKLFLEKFYIFALVFKFKRKMDESILVFSLFILWGTFSFALTRGFWIWYLNLWDQLNIYLFSVAISLTLSILIILKRYLRTKGHFQAFEDNQMKLRFYEDYVGEKYGIRPNIAFKKMGKFLFISTFVFYNLVFHFDNVIFLWILTILSPTLFLYFFNSIYLCWFFFKTPMPNNMLLQPPRAVSFFFTKVLKRDYSSSARFWTSNRKDLMPIALGTGAVITAAFSADSALASHTGETQYGSRVYTRLKGGWYTTDPKIKRRAHSLSWWGVEPSQYCYEGSKRLNPDRLNQAYETMRDEKYPSPRRTEMRELKSNLENTTSALEATQSALETTKLEMENTRLEMENTRLELERQAQANESLARRLESLEKSKEVESK